MTKYKHNDCLINPPEPKICPKCKINDRGFQSYCKDCQNSYQRVRRKRPDVLASEREYRREYRRK
jgi:hypothetical protein